MLILAIYNKSGVVSKAVDSVLSEDHSMAVVA
jgi:hypothetical protein